LNINLLKVLTVIFLGFQFVCACSPAFDWRIIHQNENKWKAHFPNKPFKTSRDFNIEINNISVNLKMTQYVARAEKMKFVVDASEIPEKKLGLEQLSEKLITTLKVNFNLQEQKKIINLDESILFFSGVISVADGSPIKIKLMTKTLLKEDVLVRGIIYGEHKGFIEDQAIFS
jgi:hypothetical protein